MTQPNQASTLIDHLVGKVTLAVDTYTDGTSTEVFAYDALRGHSGRGVARRRKGDRRDVAVGHTIALARALRDLADKIEDDLR